MYLKRNKTPKMWPIERKGTTYSIRPSHGLSRALPVLIAVRDVLGLAGNRKEVKKLINAKKIKVNGKLVRKDSFPLMLFDIICLGDKNFKLVFKNRKLGLAEIKGSEAEEKIVKVIGKKMQKKGKIQVNLDDGRNCLIKEKIKVGDSVIISLKENNIKEMLPFRVGCRIMFVSGKHVGENGKVEEIDEKKKLVIVRINEEKLNAKLANMMVIK